MPSIRGVLPALVTPLDGAGRLDRAGLDRLLDHVLAAPLAGIAPGGSTGEGPLLSPEQRVELAGAVRARLTADQWLVPGVPAPTAAAALGEIEALAGAGASAVLLPPPWYYPLGPAEVVRYFTTVADAAALPLVLYNIPRFTKVSLDPEVVAELAGHPRIVGTKDSSGDLEHLTRTARLTAATDDFSVLTGTDGSFLDALTAGGDGLIGASVNVAPGLAQRLYDAARAGDADEARAVQGRIAAVVAACDQLGFPAGWKAALHVLGVCGSDPAHPLPGPDPAGLPALRAALAGLGITDA